MNKIKRVAWREIVFQLRKRDLYFSTFGVPLLAIILALVVRLTGGTSQDNVIMNTLALQPKAITIGVIDQAAVLQPHTSLISPTKLLLLNSTSDGETALRDETIAAMYTIPADYRSTGVVTRTTRAVTFGIEEDRALQTLLVASQIQTAPITFAARFVQPLTIERTYALGDDVRISGDITNNPSSASIPIIFAMGIYFSIFMGASLLMQGILEEKENRTLEILLTSVSPRELLAGKLIGLGIVALLQLMIWAILGLLFWRSSVGIIASVSAVAIPWSVWVLLVVFFVLGYIFYATLMAGIGAISPSMRELSQLILIVTIPAILPILFLPVMLSKPNGTVALVLSVVPFTAPSTMMMRHVLTVVPWWQTALSLGVMTISAVVMLRVIARLFKASTLLIGSKFSLRQIWQALK